MSMKQEEIYIVEDMAITRAAIITVLKRHGYKIAGSATSAENAYFEILNKKPSLVIIDINLKGTKDGIWLAAKLRISINCAIIFLTALGSDTVLKKIHDTEPDGYIMKPFNNPTLLASVTLALRNHAKQKHLVDEKNNWIYLKTRIGTVKIDKRKIIYLQSDGNYVHIYFASNQLDVRAKLAEILTFLDYENLIQIHRRYAVNMEKTICLNNTSVTVENNKELPFSKSFDYKKLVLHFNSKNDINNQF